MLSIHMAAHLPSYYAIHFIPFCAVALSYLQLIFFTKLHFNMISALGTFHINISFFFIQSNGKLGYRCNITMKNPALTMNLSISNI